MLSDLPLASWTLRWNAQVALRRFATQEVLMQSATDRAVLYFVHLLELGAHEAAREGLFAAVLRNLRALVQRRCVM